MGVLATTSGLWAFITHLAVQDCVPRRHWESAMYGEIAALGFRHVNGRWRKEAA